MHPPENTTQEKVVRVLNEDIESLKSTLREKDELLNTAQLQLAQASKLTTLGTLGAGVAHELNNPLTIISGEAEEILYTIETGSREDAMTTISAQRIRQAADRMRLIVDHIRRCIRKDEDTPWERVDITQLVRDSLIILDSQLKNRGIAITLDLGDQLPAVWGHPVKLDSVIQNLLTNARDAFETITDQREKKVSIMTSCRAGKTIVISVRDNAAGMTDEVKARIFELFFTTKKLGDGMGLGLAMCSGYIKEHRGSIEVQSKKDEGTVFTIKLPIEKRTRANASGDN